MHQRQSSEQMKRVELTFQWEVTDDDQDVQVTYKSC